MYPGSQWAGHEARGYSTTRLKSLKFNFPRLNLMLSKYITFVGLFYAVQLG